MARRCGGRVRLRPEHELRRHPRHRYRSSGALVPGVTVTVVNIDTGVSKDYPTNDDGLYDTSSIVAGNYKLTFTKRRASRLCAAPSPSRSASPTVNAQLKVGATTPGYRQHRRSAPQHRNGNSPPPWKPRPWPQLPNVGGSNSPTGKTS